MIGATAPDGTDLWHFGSTRLLAISYEATYIADLSPAKLDRFATEMLVEGVPADVRLSNEHVIPHGELTSVVGDEKNLTLEIRHESLQAASISQEGYRHCWKCFLTISDIDLFYEILDSWRRHLGRKATLRRKAFSPLRATFAPILVAGAVAWGTWFFAGIAGEEEVPVPRGRDPIEEDFLIKVIEWLGPTGVMVVGGLGLLACAYRGYKRFKDPPILVTVKPK